MSVRHNRGPSPGWREFPKRHAPAIWACDFFSVRTVLFQTLHVFFVVRHANREILHAEVTRHPIAAWAAQQIVECGAWDRAPPRFLIHDRDSRLLRALIVACGTLAYGKFVRLFVLSERNLRRALSAYVTYYSTARSDRELHAGRRCLCLRKDAERSLGTLCSAGCTTFIGLPSDISAFLRPTAKMATTMCGTDMRADTTSADP
jgi:hypothetical protein